MNINFNNLEIHHAVMHTVKKKEEPHETAQPEFEDEQLTLDDSVTDVIRERLINAMGKASKAFQLDILGEFADIDHLISAQTDHRFRGKVTT
ncbi:hypothetical protein MTO98_14505 [Mucilaginibacter sp. SMC90]|uniref:hypothetical protein n=1 Tax=Mucilaginibacter sp. SMC90 TaxID=2929803 RepID=UPI001FB25D1E|nr:hypothetical protein [Mucilaginibacter sp. SMC90]UOE52289.1 hypothetical protein MTO98_14505 [Mucilaginibacter sp. SMC90]